MIFSKQTKESNMDKIANLNFYIDRSFKKKR